MGIPSFFRWLQNKYPKVLISVKENIIYNDNNEAILPDPSESNPNNIEFDNLYLDCNGIIHPCCHPEPSKGPKPKNETEMIQNIFNYIEHIFSMIRPRKLLYIAIDGVAPRAKMNQQRARRFRANQELTELNSLRDKIKEYYASKGVAMDDDNKEDNKSKHWDHNVITPGTPFMDKLSKELKIWIKNKIKTDKSWRDIKVIFSDGNVPGEGEHKINAFIRMQRFQKGYNPNMTHVMYGLDADLFMLGLATHEPNFYLLREDLKFGRKCKYCGKFGHNKIDCKYYGNKDKKVKIQWKRDKFIFARLFVLREYLSNELKINGWNEWNLERIIDDFIFICFFIGNDFLPHLPCLEIREGAIDKLMDMYKRMVPNMGYITVGKGNVNLKNVGKFIGELAKLERKIFVDRGQSNAIFRKENELKVMRKREILYGNGNGNDGDCDSDSSDDIRGLPDSMKKRNDDGKEPPVKKRKMNNGGFEGRYKDKNIYSKENIEFMEYFKEVEFDVGRNFNKFNLEEKVEYMNKVMQDGMKRNDGHGSDKIVDVSIDFNGNNWKEMYYGSKFHIKLNGKNDAAKLYDICTEYIKGLCWVYKYYYQGCPSWSWFYPYHYAPLACDLIDIQGLNIKFDLGKPFSPFGQLMGVLPYPSIKIALPHIYATLLDNPKCSISDFYPSDFRLDLNGKRFLWQSVVLLPFIDEQRLLKAIKPLKDKLNEEEKRRNGIGYDCLYCHNQNKLKICYEELNMEDEDLKENKIKISKILGDSGDIYGYLMLTDEVKQKNDNVLCFKYELPRTKKKNIKNWKITGLLDGCDFKQKILNKEDHPKFKKRFTRESMKNFKKNGKYKKGFKSGKYNRKSKINGFKATNIMDRKFKNNKKRKWNKQ